MLCGKCGKELKEGAKFCIYCGEPIAVAAPVVEAPVVKAKSYKKTILMIIIAVVLVVTGVFIYKFLTRPYAKFDKALETSATETNELYKQIESKTEKQKAIDKALIHINTLKEEYCNSADIKANDVISEVKELSKGVLSSHDSEVNEVITCIENVEYSRECFAQALSDYTEENYFSALDNMNCVIPDDVINYSQAQEYISTFKQAIVDGALKNYNDMISKDRYESAKNELEIALEYVPENEELARKLEEIDKLQEEYSVKVCSEYVQKALNSNDYSEVFTTLSSIIMKYPQNQKLIDLQKVANDAFYEYYNPIIATLEEAKDYSSLEEIIKEMINCKNQDNSLYEKLKYYESLRPKSLFDFEIYDSHFSENMFMGSYGVSLDKERTDTYNNVYPADSVAGLICGQKYGNYDKDEGGRLTFVNDGYVRLKGVLAYDKDGQKNGTVYFRVYADDQLVYDSELITDNTAPIEFEVNIEGCHMFSIFWGTATSVEAKAWGETTNGQGTIILSNPFLYKY